MSRKAPPRRRTQVAHLTRCNAIRRYLLAEYGRNDTWAAVGAKLGISGGMAYRVAVRGYWPRDRGIQRRIKRAVMLDYDAWREGERARLAEVLAWAETHTR